MEGQMTKNKLAAVPQLPPSEKLNVKNLFEDGGLKICSEEEARAKGVYPNRVAWPSDDPKVCIILLYKSKKGTDYALSLAAVNRMKAALADGRIREGYVVLVQRPHTYVDGAPLQEIVELIAGREVMTGEWGDYVWITAPLRPNLDEAPM
jgi:hypothetical protein